MAKQVQELSETLLEIGRKFYPPRYRRFKDLRPFDQACEWARGLDWRNNPYDRFLLRRQLLRHLETTAVHDPVFNVYSYASRGEIAAELDRILDNLPKDLEYRVFVCALLEVRWDLAFKHGRVQYGKLTKALANWPCSTEN